MFDGHYKVDFAGLWDAWKDLASDKWLQGYSIITTDANEVMAPIHDRMRSSCTPAASTAGSTAIRKLHARPSTYCAWSARR